MQAITPSEAKAHVDDREFPDFVIQAFNECIKEAMIHRTNQVEQEEVIMRMLSLNPTLERHEIFDNHYLDVEAYYGKQGWKVEYHKPAYYEGWKPYWEFNV